jgi:hypothetical protein
MPLAADCLTNEVFGPSNFKKSTVGKTDVDRRFFLPSAF